jgi:hypothetical protein
MTPEHGSVRAFLAVRSTLLALIWMNKKALSLINHPFKTTTTAVSVWLAVDFHHYGGVSKKTHVYSLVLQLYQKYLDDSVAVRVQADEKKSNVPYHLAHAALSTPHPITISSSQW